MSQPRYFLKNARHEGANSLADGGDLNRQMLKDYGLDETFRDVRLDEVVRNPVTGRGPDGCTGTVLTYQTPDKRIPKITGYDEKLTWHKVSDLVWVGIDDGDPPKEEDLRRKRMCGGNILQINNQGYTIPVTRTPDNTSKLPADIVFGDGGLHLPVKQEYLLWWNASEKIVQWFFNPSFRDTCSDTELAEVAILNFGLNYRYGKFDQNLLRLIDTDNLYTIIAWNCSLFDYAEVQTNGG